MRERLRLDDYTSLTIIVSGWILGVLMGDIQVVEPAPTLAPSLAPAPAPTPAPYPYPIAKKGCREMCGNISIPYPFGIGENCFYGNTFGYGYNFYNITCNDSFNPPRPFYGEGIRVLNISFDGEFRISRRASYACYNGLGNLETNTSKKTNWVDMKRFTLSTTKNILVTVGCDTYVWFEGRQSDNPYWLINPELFNETRPFYSGCMTMCNTINEVPNSGGLCSGIGCCKALIPEGVTNISSQVGTFYNHTYVNNFNPCSSGFVVATDAFPVSARSLVTQDAAFYRNNTFPIVFDWSIGIDDNCASAKARVPSDYICKGNSQCLDMRPTVGGYRCQCLPGFHGNPYLEDCQDIDECEKNNPCEKGAKCNNFAGGYNCICPKGFLGNGTMDHPCTPDSNTPTPMPNLPIAVKIIIGICCGIIVFLVVAILLYLQHEHKRTKRMRKSFFSQNGGHLLAKKLERQDKSINMVTIFTVEELEKATNNFNENNIIGRGSFGMVYKGVISSPKDQVVAIKKSLKVDSNQIEQFVNEVLVLSQLNHKNVVKLLGCCLEKDVPLLVYEYIENGTLYDHLHDERRVSLLTNWEVRLVIAVEIAEVLAYLHYTISTPIIHRDIKSMNILLDNNYTSKVSDFGTSRLVPMDKEQIATIVQGTCGYLDPEYLQTGELTEKSDVYSFGVVLLELLTRENAISSNRAENERCLAIYFLRKLKEDRLFEILDNKMIIDDGAMEQVKEVANIARRCLKLKGEDRPSMKQVARELDEIRGNGSHPWANNRRLFQEDTEYLLNETQTYNE